MGAKKFKIELRRVEELREQMGVTKVALAKAMGLTEDGYRYKERKGTLLVRELDGLAEGLNMTPAAVIEFLTVGSTDTIPMVNEKGAAYGKWTEVSEADGPLELIQALYPHRELLAYVLERSEQLRQK